MLHLAATGGTGVSLRLIGPNGQVITYLADANAGITTAALGATGTYTLLVEGGIDAGSGAQGLTILANKVVNSTTATSLGSQINATIASPGQQQNYTFTVTTATDVLVDALGYDSRFFWTLTSPDGTTVTRAFNAPFGSGGNPLLLLGPGQYTLTIGATQNATGSVSVRLIDAAQAPVITPGQPNSGSLAPAGQANVFQLNGRAGEVLDFQAQQEAGGTATWQLIGPNGNTVFLGGFANTGPYTLATTGTYYLLILDENQDTAPPLTYGFNVFDDTPSTPVPITPGSTAAAPDLVVQNLNVVAPSGTIQSGAALTVSWQDVNIGNAAANASWTDELLITDVTTGAIIDQQQLPSKLTEQEPQGTVTQQATLTLPSGIAGVGQLTVTVITDVGNTLGESNLTDTGITNNTTSVSVTSTLAVYPDLVASNLTVSPSSDFVPGQTVTVSWTTTNQGGAATGGNGWTDQLTVIDTTTGHQIATATVVQPNGTPLAPGAALQRSVQFTWPSGADASGSFRFVVTVDPTDQVIEASHADNQTTLVALSAPDILVQNLQTSTSPIVSGGTVVLSWNDVNTGTAATPNGWSDQVAVVTNQAIWPANPAPGRGGQPRRRGIAAGRHPGAIRHPHFARHRRQRRHAGHHRDQRPRCQQQHADHPGRVQRR